jgi:hypothetical protein
LGCLILFEISNYFMKIIENLGFFANPDFMIYFHSISGFTKKNTH